MRMDSEWTQNGLILSFILSFILCSDGQRHLSLSSSWRSNSKAFGTSPARPAARIMDMTFIASSSHGRHGRHGRAQSRSQMPKKKQILDDSWIHGFMAL